MNCEYCGSLDNLNKVRIDEGFILVCSDCLMDEDDLLNNGNIGDYILYGKDIELKNDILSIEL